MNMHSRSQRVEERRHDMPAPLPSGEKKKKKTLASVSAPTPIHIPPTHILRPKNKDGASKPTKR